VPVTGVSKMRRFSPEYSSDPKYDKRLDLINKYFKTNGNENEEIYAEADIGWKCPNDIYISYKCTRNKKYFWHSIHLDPNLMCILTEETINQILNELLAIWRTP